MGTALCQQSPALPRVTESRTEHSTMTPTPSSIPPFPLQQRKGQGAGNILLFMASGQSPKLDGHCGSRRGSGARDAQGTAQTSAAGDCSRGQEE